MAGTDGPVPHALVPALAAGLLLVASASAHTARAYDLLTAAEYAERTPAGATRSLTAAANDGPEIIVHTPETSGALRSPLDFDVEFRAKDALPVMGSLLVEYDLGLFWKDVTARLAEHAEITENRIISRGAELPAGDHHLRLSISDEAGKTTTTTMVLTVAE
jgi:hypothetical protein